MSRLVPILAAALAAALPAMAQQQPGGFFPPKPDPALSRTLAPEDYPDTRPPAIQPAAAPSAAPAATPAAPVAAPPVPAPDAAVPASVETQMDRSEAEARRAQEDSARAPPRINGAFTGSTDERDR